MLQHLPRNPISSDAKIKTHSWVTLSRKWNKNKIFLRCCKTAQTTVILMPHACELLRINLEDKLLSLHHLSKSRWWSVCFSFIFELFTWVTCWSFASPRFSHHAIRESCNFFGVQTVLVWKIADRGKTASFFAAILSSSEATFAAGQIFRGSDFFLSYRFLF